jgi:hypothetical protein
VEKQRSSGGCSLAPPAPTILRAWAETVVEVSTKLGESLGAQVRAGLRAAEGGLRLAAARDVDEFCARLLECLRTGFDCLQPLADLPVQAARFAVAWRLHVAGGMTTVAETEYQQRLAVCAACEHFHDNHCLACGCRLAGAVVAKARWADEQCPLEKWPPPHAAS